MSRLLGDKTVYVFTDDTQREEYQGPQYMMPYVYYVNCAFTHDHTGSNLPVTSTQWVFAFEVQPGSKFLLPTAQPVDMDALRRGLKEKGWMLARVWLGARAWSEFKNTNSTVGPLNYRISHDCRDSSQTLSPEAQAVFNRSRGS